MIRGGSAGETAFEGMRRELRGPTRAFAQFIGSLCAVVSVPPAHAVPQVDPTAIEAESPEMLQPAAFYSFCGPNAFAVSLDPVQLRSADKAQGEEVKHPLGEAGGTNVITCKQGGREVVATLTVAPPRESGMCAALHHIHVKLSVDGQVLLTTKFANYCAPWGLSSFSLLGLGESSPHSTLRSCGYWNEEIAVMPRGDKISKRSFECADFSALEMLSSKLYLSDGTHQVHSLEP